MAAGTAVKPYISCSDIRSKECALSSLLVAAYQTPSIAKPRVITVSLSKDKSICGGNGLTWEGDGCEGCKGNTCRIVNCDKNNKCTNTTLIKSQSGHRAITGTKTRASASGTQKPKQSAGAAGANTLNGSTLPRTNNATNNGRRH
jgi:hypothetical protein